LCYKKLSTLKAQVLAQEERDGLRQNAILL